MKTDYTNMHAQRTHAHPQLQTRSDWPFSLSASSGDDKNEFLFSTSFASPSFAHFSLRVGPFPTFLHQINWNIFRFVSWLKLSFHIGRCVAGSHSSDSKPSCSCLSHLADLISTVSYKFITSDNNNRLEFKMIIETEKLNRRKIRNK